MSNSVIKNCMTPREELPRQLVLSTGVIAWLVLILAWVLLAASDIVPDCWGHAVLKLAKHTVSVSVEFEFKSGFESN